MIGKFPIIKLPTSQILSHICTIGVIGSIGDQYFFCSPHWWATEEILISNTISHFHTTISRCDLQYDLRCNVFLLASKRGKVIISKESTWTMRFVLFVDRFYQADIPHIPVKTEKFYRIARVKGSNICYRYMIRTTIFFKITIRDRGSFCHFTSDFKI